MTYMETLIAVTVLAIALVPALTALRAAVSGTSAHEAYVVAHQRMAGRLEDILTEPFGALDAEAAAVANETVATSYSEAPGTPNRLLVFLSRYDGDDADGDGNPFTGEDEGLLWIRVETQDTDYSLETLTSP